MKPRWLRWSVECRPHLPTYQLPLLNVLVMIPASVISSKLTSEFPTDANPRWASMSTTGATMSDGAMYASRRAPAARPRGRQVRRRSAAEAAPPPGRGRASLFLEKERRPQRRLSSGRRVVGFRARRGGPARASEHPNDGRRKGCEYRYPRGTFSTAG